MAEQMRATLHRLKDTHLTVADDADDIRGRRVVDREGDEIGTVSELLIDGEHRKVRFLEVAAGGFLGIGEEKLMLPVDAVTRIDGDTVHVDHSRDRIVGAPRYAPELVAKEDRYWDEVYTYYGYRPFWAPGYVYPPYPYLPPR